MNTDLAVGLLVALFLGAALITFLGFWIEIVTPWLNKNLAPKLGDFVGYFFPRPNKEKGILIVPGFNLAIHQDAEGNFRGADTFEEWLENAVPEEQHRKEHDHFWNRVHFYFYKRREINRT